MKPVFSPRMIEFRRRFLVTTISMISLGGIDIYMIISTGDKLWLILLLVPIIYILFIIIAIILILVENRLIIQKNNKNNQ